ARWRVWSNTDLDIGEFFHFFDHIVNGVDTELARQEFETDVLLLVPDAKEERCLAAELRADILDLSDQVGCNVGGIDPDLDAFAALYADFIQQIHVAYLQFDVLLAPGIFD